MTDLAGDTRLDGDAHAVDLFGRPNLSGFINMRALCIALAVVISAAGALIWRATGLIETLIIFPAMGIPIAFAIYALVERGVYRPMRICARLLKTGECHDARVLEAKPDYLQSDPKGGFYYTFACEYTDRGGRTHSAKSFRLSIAATGLNMGWNGRAMGDSALEVLVDAAAFIGDAAKAAQERLPLERFSAKVWVNPHDPDDYYVQMLYHPPEDAAANGSQDE